MMANGTKESMRMRIEKGQLRVTPRARSPENTTWMIVGDAIGTLWSKYTLTSPWKVLQ